MTRVPDPRGIPAAPPLAPPTVPASPTDRTRSNYLRYLNSPQAQCEFGLGTPWLGIAIATLLCLTIVGIPGGVGHFIGMSIRTSRRRKKLEEFKQRVLRFEVINTYPLMVNSLVRTTPNRVAPGLVVGSFDPSLDHAFFGHFGAFLGAVARMGPQTPAEQAIMDIMADEKFVENRRRLLPSEITGGAEVYVFDLKIIGAHFPGGRLDSVLIPCLAEPGAQGAIFTIPWQLIDSWQDRVMMMMSMDEAAPEPEIPAS